MTEKLKIIFVGSQNYGARCLEYLVKNSESVQAVFTFKPDKHETLDDETEQIALANKIRVIKSRNLKNHHDYIQELSPDLIFVVGWRTIIPEEIYSLPRLGCIGIHGSLLPKYRGFAPLNWALINGEEEVGVSMFYIGEGVDMGDIIAQKGMKVDHEDDMAVIKENFDELIVNLFIEQLSKIISGDITPVKQDEQNASYGCMRLPEDGEINWSLPATELYNFIRALGKPYPGAFTFFNGKKLYIWKASLVEDDMLYLGKPGATVKIESKGVQINTGNGVLLIEDVQQEGDEIISAPDLIGSIKARLGMNHSQ